MDRGDFAERLLEVVRPSLLHLVDPWAYDDSAAYAHTRHGGRQGQSQERMDQRYEAVLERLSAPISSEQVVVHRTTSADAAGAIPDGSLDWVYIDGNHRYEFVVDDLERYLPKVRPGGLITGDDYSAHARPEIGVKQAVDEFVAVGKAKFVRLVGRQFILRP